MNPSLHSCLIDLPAHFRCQDILAFHRRDSQQLAEQVEGDALRKGLLWAGQPACLSIRFTAGQATAELAIDGPSTAPRRKSPWGTGTAATLNLLAQRLLGLTQPVDAFAAAYRDHPQLGRLLAERPGLRVPQTATPFEALSWAVTGQQISVHAAVAVRRKLIQTTGSQHSSGLWCYPDAAQVAASSEAELRQAGFSQSKAATLFALARQVADGQLPLDDWLACETASLPVDAIREQLLQVRGIGPWTVNYALLRGFGWLDGSLHGDVAVRRKLQHLLGANAPLSERQTAAWLDEFKPWRALVGAHLWAMPL
ncbi:hypothetical protein AT959_16060 [Dechloromonas denitrificans]|uniref:DNA-3-methyladenine glycosylase II n=1 Tax=Dechloromonas denitrificans TaxID=281362 RepID=A0A133XET9_9RHOO|nr:DNA-3-methyladenine glycosylase 2 [Dechloromonas denitrificans]KXB29465.1 hypothetical protein AT959_16060 [Dechloromonas denitrificans]